MNMMNLLLSQQTLKRPTNCTKNMFSNVSAILDLQNSAGFILRLTVMLSNHKYLKMRKYYTFPYLHVNMDMSMIFNSGF